MARFLHGVRLPHRKHTANQSAVRMDPPQFVTLSTSMHIGKPAVPCVKVGDHVYVGTRVAEQDGFISSPVFSSVSGTVKRLEETLTSAGKLVPAIVVESDGLMEPDPAIAPPTVNSREELVSAIRESGLVGLGGAAFPTYVKFHTDDPASLTDWVINGAECEPYITSDSIGMVDRFEDIALAIETVDRYFSFERILIGIEKNKPDAIRSMKRLEAINPKIRVCPLPSIYPQGGEKVLVYHTTGKVIPLGKLPASVGCVVTNSTTVATIGSYLRTGMPLVEKCVTVDGSAVKEPKNVIVPIGTSLSDLFAFAGGFTEDPGKVLYGGPMMGIAVPSLDAPVLKGTNAVLAFKEKDAKLPDPTPCIRCGRCTNVCPFGINPAEIAFAYKTDNMEVMPKWGLTLCMECGCCSYVCPARRPLIQTNKLAKVAYKKYCEKEENKHE